MLKKTESGQSDEDRTQWKFYHHQNAIEKDSLQRKKEQILQNGRYQRQFEKTTE